MKAQTGTRSTTAEARQRGEKVERSRAFQWLARSGFAARAVVYGIIGALALEVALGEGGTTANQQGAFETIVRQPAGTVLLVLVAIGLAGYALWRLLHALLGHGPEESDSRAERLAALASGLAYVGLCALAIEILTRPRAGSTGSAHKEAAGVLGWPAGTWLIGIVGAGFVGVGLFQGYRAWSADFLEDAKTEEMGAAVRRAYEWVARFGYVARMIVFGLIGILLVVAAAEYDPNKAVGLDGALAKLAHTSYGPYLLGVVAAGLISFGVYSLEDARYRRL